MLPKAELGRRFCEPPGCPGPPANLRTRERAGAPFPLVAAQTSVAHTSTSDSQSLVLERGRLRYLRPGPRSPVPGPRSPLCAARASGEGARASPPPGRAVSPCRAPELRVP